MICLLSILLLAATAIAQPVEGPWGVLTVEDGWTLGQMRVISIGPDTVGIFYGEESPVGDIRARYATFLVGTHSLLAPPVTLSYAADWRATFDDAMPLGDGTWVCAIHSETGNTYGVGQNAAILMYGSPSTPDMNTYVLHEGETHPIGFCWGNCSAMMDCHLSPRQEGGALVASSVLDFFDIPAREIDGYVSLHAFGSSFSTPDWIVQPFAPASVGPSVSWSVSTTADSALVINHSDWYGGLILHAGAENSDSVGIYDIQNMVRPLHVMYTSDARILVFGSSAFYTVVEVSPDGESQTLFAWQPDSSVDALASNSGHGFGALFVRPSSIALARFTTNGQVDGSDGTFYWRDNDHVIVDGNLTIADDGRVIVLWSERDEGSADATRLRIGTVGWDTPLQGSDSDFVLHPSSFVPSCYPNPFNSAVTIHYELPTAADIEVSVFNLLGERIAVLKSGREVAGAHSIEWQPEVGSGIYFVSVEAGSTRDMRKIVYLK